MAIWNLICKLMVLGLGGLTLFIMGCLSSSVPDGYHPGLNSSGAATPAPTPNYNYVFAPSFNDSTLHVFSMAASGSLTEVSGSPYTVGTQPRSIAIHPNKQILYLLCGSCGSLDGYSIDANTGALTTLSGYPLNLAGLSSSQKVISITPDGRYLYIVESGSIGGFSINSTTGALSALPGSPWSPHYSTTFSIAMDSHERYFYLGQSSSGMTSIDGFMIDSATGNLTEMSGVPFTVSVTNPTSLTLDSTGSHLYLGGFDSGNVAGYDVNTATGALTEITGSPWATGGTQPNRLHIDPTGKYLYTANYGSNNLSGFSIDSTTGALTALSGFPLTSGNGVTSLIFDATGSFLFAGDYNDSYINGYSVDTGTGALTLLSISPFTAGSLTYDLGFLNTN